ncbi:MAG: adenine deaminase [Clostridium sp.]|uniref:adenine deaminase n=3 Tax=Clostridium sp. TaxID=1506 RepID=UPI002FC94068
MNSIKRKIDVAAKREKADLVIKNAKVINVFTNEIVEGNLAIDNGYIIGIGNYIGEKEIDIKGKYIAPSFIDSHVHIESSMSTPAQFSKHILSRGTTTIIADPHEIANVCGLSGIEYILDATEKLPLDVYVMLPSCVPATDFETSGAVLNADSLEKIINHERVLGLGELMDFPGVVAGNSKIIDKLHVADGKIIDGHGPLIENEELNAYVIAGVKTEHECSTKKEMEDRLQRGMYVQIREGTAARNLEDLIPYVNKDNMRRCIFCTDDKHPEDILKRGHIDNNIRMAVKLGLDPVDAIKMASLNSAECYGLKNKGAIAPGYIADMVVFEDLKDIDIEMVFKDGALIAENKKMLIEVEDHVDERVLSKVNIKEFTKEDVALKLNASRARVIELIDHSLVTKLVEKDVLTENGEFNVNPEEDIVKIVLVERHTGSSKTAVALVKGFGIKNGAIGVTVAHDSHNIIVIGDSDDNIVKCINEIKHIGGGIVISSRGEVISSLPLKIAGLMSEKTLEEVDLDLQRMMEITRSLSVSSKVDPFMTLAFLALPVIPEVKITDKGLFDVVNFKFIDINP